ncbi:MAG: c-type cytochrome [Candidatus Promineifilaceae bacterium]
MKILKWIGLGLVVLIGLVVVLALVLNFVGSNKMANAPEVTVRPISVPTDADTIARGEYIVHNISGCAGCHGENLGGGEFFDGPPFGYVPAPNLTSSGAGSNYQSAEDWLRAIQHGVAADGRTIAPFMPVTAFSQMSDEDIAAVIAYLQTVPAADNDVGTRKLSFPGPIIFGVLGYSDMPVSTVDHDSVGGTAPTPGKTAEYGKYLTTIAVCADCHGPDLTGAVDPNGPQGPNLTPGGSLGAWTEEDFLTLLQTGVKPSGTAVSDEMPWEFYSGMNDDELGAIWLYLQSLPAQETAVN